MKTLKFLFVLFAFIGLSFQAMPQAASYEINTSTMKVYYVIDTVSNSTGVTITYPAIVPAGWGYVIECVADSLTGSTAGTFTVLSSGGTTSSKVYKAITSGTATIDGLQTVALFEPPADKPSWTGTAIRVTASGGGTQSTKVRVWITLKKLPLY
jgi:hypothetical protein